MLISHRKQFIYTKTHKTAGTSVEVYFEKYCMPEGQWTFRQVANTEYVSDTGIIGLRATQPEGVTWYNHMPAAEIRDKIGEDIWSRYFKFCVVRDPFDKLLSGFFYGHRDRDWQQEDPVPVFREWVMSDKFGLDRDKYVIDGELCLDHIIRFEALEQGIWHVCGVLGVPYDPRQLPRLKAGFRNTTLPMSAFYDRETTDFVCRKFAFELETFGYAPPVAA